MRSCSMDSETSAPKDTGRIGNIAKANGRHDGQRQFPPWSSGGVQPRAGNSVVMSVVPR
jgi:hypothetical protein